MYLKNDDNYACNADNTGLFQVAYLATCSTSVQNFCQTAGFTISKNKYSKKYFTLLKSNSK